MTKPSGDSRLTRREVAAALAAISAGATPSHAAESVTHDMSSMPASWMGNETIAFLIYPGFTALDMVGPHYMLSNLMGAKTHVVARTRELVKSDTGLVFQPSADFSECPETLDILCVPGGSDGTIGAIRDASTIAFLKAAGSRAKFVTSVCTGSLLLGAAGLLDGYHATSHWAARSLLPLFGAIPVNQRVVRDRNRITGAGVTAGLDFGLRLVEERRDRAYAEGVQLLSEYAPEPPVDSGTPERAKPDMRALIGGMFSDFLTEASEAIKAARS